MQKLHWLPITECIMYKVAYMCFYDVNGSGPFYLFELLHVYTLSHIHHSSSVSRILKIQQYKCKTPGVFSSALGLTFGTHSLLISGTAQLFFLFFCQNKAKNLPLFTVLLPQLKPASSFLTSLCACTRVCTLYLAPLLPPISDV